LSTPLALHIAAGVAERVRYRNATAFTRASTAALINQLADCSSAPRAVEELQRRGHAGIELLLRAIQRADVGLPAARLLGRLGSSAVMRCVEMVAEAGPRAAGLAALALMHGDDEGRAAFLDMLRSASSPIQARLLDTLREFPEDAADTGMWSFRSSRLVLTLSELYMNDGATEALRASILHVLAGAGDVARDASGFLGHILRTEGAPSLRGQALSALCVIVPNSPEAVEGVMSALRDAHERVRLRALLAARTLQHPSPTLVRRIAALLCDEDRAVRLETCNTLGILGREAQDALPQLNCIAQDGRADIELSSAAARALDRIRRVPD